MTIEIDPVLQLIESEVQQLLGRMFPGIDKTIRPGLQLTMQKCRVTIYERYKNLSDLVGSAIADDQMYTRKIIRLLLRISAARGWILQVKLLSSLSLILIHSTR